MKRRSAKTKRRLSVAKNVRKRKMNRNWEATLGKSRARDCKPSPKCSPRMPTSTQQSLLKN